MFISKKHCLRLFAMAAMAAGSGTQATAQSTFSRLDVLNAGDNATFVFGKNSTEHYFMRYINASPAVFEYFNDGTEHLIAEKRTSGIMYYPKLFLDKDLLVQGNVGIGTNTPLYKLHVETPASVGFLLRTVNSSVQTPAVDFLDHTRGVETIISSTDNSVNGTYIASYSNHPLLFGTNAGTTPAAKMKLQPNGDLVVLGNSNFLGNTFVAETDWTYTTASGSWQVGSNHLGGTGNQFFIWNDQDSKYHFVVQRVTGNVGIGVTSPPADYKLAVGGTIGARRVKVTSETWADFVFKPGYSLRTLQDVETFIKDHGHLPDIPSEATVKKNGIDLGDMNARLLQKIEELTLYLIEQKKEISELREAVKKLKQ
ncbi:hypothetical protein EGT74_04705 [Chitinophaga lutea]|uniref:BZIP transcription factor n=1 Tax=Chitinophaga lutea TaxID=2488634 RepID=A0A3N4Q9Z4_9BACT|nr:hypothetical protein [Chitinophaga lutea]RPE12847.1 hypothetical protein EGT74_04705 [Chitinophaga lutea]